jgi:predicted O-methyltransferase YrrM
MKAWMDDKEKLLITKHFSPDKVMLEWGSGGSTIEFSPKLKKYYSIEHNKEWYENVSNEISSLNYSNVNYNFIPQNIQSVDDRQSEYNQFKDYIDIVDKFDTKFDIVLIDGRARRLCAKKIIPYLNPGAIVIIHDWCVRDVYHCVTDYYDVFEYVDDTQQTIATFKLKEKPLPNAYNLNLGGWERTNENYFKKTNNKMEISLIQPGRNNLKYLKWSYDSIRKNQGIHDVQICVADDASTDGTWDWCLETMGKDSNFNAIKNEGPERLGHTILYDRLVNEVAKYDVCMIYHADMYLCPGALDAIEKHLKPKTIVSLTRIEPPLHPDGPEKILQDFGVEPEEFKEENLLKFLYKDSHSSESGLFNDDKITEGIFAPWAFYKKDFQEIGGHDPLYAPQSKEDSDIFNRFQLNGIKFIQTWYGCVYHMTCRGSRRNTIDKAKNIYEDSPEWLAQNMRSSRNFIRKWGHFCKHDALMKPIIPPKYDIGIILNSKDINLLNNLEPWCNTIYTNCNIQDYIKVEQQNTIIDLYERVKPYDNEKNNNILITIDNNFNEQDMQYLSQLSEILEDNGEIGKFELGNLKIDIIEMKNYVNELIKL